MSTKFTEIAWLLPVVIHLLKVSRVTFFAEGSNGILRVEHRSPYVQVLGALVYGCDHKGIKVFLASHH